MEPATGKQLWSGPIGNVDKEVGKARANWASWASKPLAVRTEALRRFANCVLGQKDKFADLIARVEKTVAWLNGIKPAQIDGTEEKPVVVKMPNREMNFKGLELLLNRSMPNFYFHTTTAYDILRHNGIEIGKRDFMGG